MYQTIEEYQDAAYAVLKMLDPGPKPRIIGNVRLHSHWELARRRYAQAFQLLMGLPVDGSAEVEGPAFEWRKWSDWVTVWESQFSGMHRARVVERGGECVSEGGSVGGYRRASAVRRGAWGGDSEAEPVPGQARACECAGIACGGAGCAGGKEYWRIDVMDGRESLGAQVEGLWFDYQQAKRRNAKLEAELADRDSRPVMPAPEPRPVKVRFDVTPERFIAVMSKQYDVHVTYDAAVYFMDYLAVHAVIEAPADLPSDEALAEALHEAYLSGDDSGKGIQGGRLAQARAAKQMLAPWLREQAPCPTCERVRKALVPVPDGDPCSAYSLRIGNILTCDNDGVWQVIGGNWVDSEVWVRLRNMSTGEDTELLHSAMVQPMRLVPLEEFD